MTNTNQQTNATEIAVAEFNRLLSYYSSMAEAYQDKQNPGFSKFLDEKAQFCEKAKNFLLNETALLDAMTLLIGK